MSKILTRNPLISAGPVNEKSFIGKREKISEEVEIIEK
jgi:hypothetical protein